VRQAQRRWRHRIRHGRSALGIAERKVPRTLRAL
jgi:hypothetical protein